MGTRNHDLEHASWYAAYIVDIDTQSLPNTVMLGGNFLAWRHDSFYAFCFIEIEKPATDRVFTREYAKADFTNPILELVVEMFVLSFSNTLQYDLLCRLCWNAREDVR